MDTGNIMENQLQEMYDGFDKNKQIEDEEIRQAFTHIKIALESLYGESVKLSTSKSPNLIIAEKAIIYLNKLLNVVNHKANCKHNKVTNRICDSCGCVITYVHDKNIVEEHSQQ